jgi:hypothetical protein
MRRAIGRMRVQNACNRTDSMAWEAVRTIETPNVMLHTPKGGTLKAVRRDLSAWNLI